MIQVHLIFVSLLSLNLYSQHEVRELEASGARCENCEGKSKVRSRILLAWGACFNHVGRTKSFSAFISHGK
jgi:hypothetical protein